jgi:outer membrane receptor protein involved in Fe transport
MLFDHVERVASVLIGKGGALGAQYRLSNAQLQDVFPGIPESVPHFFPPYEFKPRQDLESTLHQVQFFGVLNHASGCFGRAEALWSSQSNHGYDPGRPGDSFWQFNVYAGYRLPNRRAEIRLGLLNLTDQDYRINPLNLTAELPRDRAFVASLKLSF